ncbi:MAG: S-adenosylmethionine:tRNA ribosyltransferase-isomerase, partial [Clostridiales bacterium]|nr:S-adenosylmethionine:tRNA ribosyltransferase-isomerase [Clostridiales bacterium]
MGQYRLSDFQYELPERLIAQEPARERTGSRLMVIDRRSGAIAHRHFEDLKEYVRRGDCLVFNDTKVIPARLLGEKLAGRGVAQAGPAAGSASMAAGAAVAHGADGAYGVCGAAGASGSGCAALAHGADRALGASGTPGTAEAHGAGASPARVEALLIRRTDDPYVWEALVRPGKRLKKGAAMSFGGGLLRASVEDVLQAGSRLLRFDAAGAEFDRRLEAAGRIPLPPYIKNERVDLSRYQTVYSKVPGSAAAPTAGLHFTDEYIGGLLAAGAEAAYLTLHVGPGTFRPVKTENIEDHVMHSEYYSIGESAAAAISRAQKGGRVICVGTTSLRALESAAGEGEDGCVAPREGWTDIFIYPGYKFKCADALL